MKRIVLIGAIVLFAAYLALWFVRFRAPQSSADSAASAESFEPSQPSSARAHASAAPISSLAHLDPEKSRALRAQLLALLTRDALPDSDPLNGKLASGAGTPAFRQTDDVKEYSKFIQDRIRSDLMPMASKCYDELLGRQPDAGGDISMDFEILGDEKIGGVVNTAELGDAGTLRDDRFASCVRESLLSVYFDPPPSHGRVTVRYPVMFSPNEKPAAEEVHLRDRRNE